MHDKVLYYVGHMHAGMENQYRIPMDQYQNNIIVTLYIQNQKCMILIIEKSKRRDVIRYPYKSCLHFFLVLPSLLHPPIIRDLLIIKILSLHIPTIIFFAL